MRCLRAEKWFSAYLDGELDPRRRAALEEHLEHCSRCAAELDRLEQQWTALADVGPVPPVPAGQWGHLVAALDEAERLPWYRLRRGELLRVACVVACVVVGFASGALLSWDWPAGDHPGAEGSVSERTLVVEAFNATAFGLGERKEGLLQCVPR